MPAEFHFIRPYFLLALIPLLIIIWLLLRHRLAGGNWTAVCDPQLLPHILVGAAGKTWHYATILIGLCGLLAILALAGPAWERVPQPLFRSDSALVIALDLSRSMDATDVDPSRLERAHYKITDLLRLRGEGQTALIVYAGDAFTVSPLTDDVKTIIAQLPALTTSIMPTQGGNIAAALAHAITLLKQAGNGDGHILLITDDLGGDDAHAPLRRALQQGYKTSILAVGTEEGAPIVMADGGFLTDDAGAIVLPGTDHEQLISAATLGGGKYMPLQTGDRDVAVLNDFFTDRGLKQGEARSDLSTDVWREQGPWLLLFILPFAALAFRRGYILILLIGVLPLPRQAQAFEWRDLWWNPDQQALQYFNAGEAEQAAAKFNDPQWKAAAKYRNGDYQSVPELLRDYKSADSFYNSGNALARQGKYQQALAAYDKALALDPAHDDAQYNRDLVQEALEQQQQQEAQEQDAAGQEAQEQDAGGQTGQGQDGAEQEAQGQDAAGQEAQEQQDAESGRQQAQAAKSAAEAEQQRAEQQQAEQTQLQSDDESQDEDTRQTAESLATNRQQPWDERAQVMEQWLRRIPDDPAGLLRRKFQYQYQQRDRRDEGATRGW